MIRCRVTCYAVSKNLNYCDDEGKTPFIYNYSFSISENRPENEDYFIGPKYGTLEFSSVHENEFEVGKDYYLDLTAVPSA